MLRKRIVNRWLCLPAALLVAGCATTGGGRQDQLTNTVYETYRHVRKLDSDLGGTVNQLNQAATSLQKRIEETDTQVAQVRSSLERNRSELDALEQQVATLTNALYRHFGLSVAPARTAAAAPPADVMVPGEVTVEGQVGPVPTALAAPSDLETVSAMPPGQSATPESAPSMTATDAAGAAEEASASSAVAAYQEATRSFRDKDYARAYQLFDDYIKKYPSTESARHAEFWRAESRFRQGSQENDRGRIQEAVNLYDQYRQAQPTSRYVPFAIHNQAVAYVELGRRDEAIRLLRQLVQDFPATEEAVKSAKEKLAELEGQG